MPARVLMQDFTGVPAVVDVAAMRDAMRLMGGDPRRVNPQLPVELVIDHSVVVDEFGTSTAFQTNADLEFQRNRERYALLRWAQGAFQGFRVVPPDIGIVHQVNLEYLARVVFTTTGKTPQAYPDTLVGTDSHTTMINGLGVLGWGVGGIEAEAAMLGQPVSMLIPQVVGFRLTGKLAEGATATDLVLTVTELLRKKGVVGKFVEFYGPGIAALPVADRATIGNMSPEYGATVGVFAVDQETLRYLEFTGRPQEQVQLVEAYMKEQGLFHTPGAPEPAYSDTLALDLSTVEPSLAGPRRPQDRVALGAVPRAFLEALPSLVKPTSPIAPPTDVRNHWEAEGGQPFGGGTARSEEHTSELQSRRDLVCRLLLERSAVTRDPHSFPTRRSSDLGRAESRRAPASARSCRPRRRAPGLPRGAALACQADVADRTAHRRAQPLGSRGRAAVRRRHRGGSAAAPHARGPQGR